MWCSIDQSIVYCSASTSKPDVRLNNSAHPADADDTATAKGDGDLLRPVRMLTVSCQQMMVQRQRVHRRRALII